jgi:UDP-N-acetylglucosamine 4-epimerase
VIPKWVQSMIRGEDVFINGDGETTRDFCHVANVVQANILAATAKSPEAVNEVYNVGLGRQSTLNELFACLREKLISRFPLLKSAQPKYRDFRPGDVRHSQADISRIAAGLGYSPEVDLKAGLDAAMDWYVDRRIKT